ANVIRDNSNTLRINIPALLSGKYNIQVTNSDGKKAVVWDAVTVDSESPSTPSGLSVVAGDNKVDLSWLPSSNADTAGYNIYRAASPFVKINNELLKETTKEITLSANA
ncbi:MAG: hypothetical protein V1859_07875, partial [archaeon]